MQKKEVLKKYGSVKAVAEALGITVGAVYLWPERVPERSAARLHKLTRGKLKYELEDYLK